MSLATVGIALRLRGGAAILAALGLIAVMAAVGALFPAVGHSIGALKVPASVANMLGGADYGTVTGWFRSEIAIIYGPLVIGAVAVSAAVGLTAGLEEDRVLALVLAHPIRRRTLVAAQAVAVLILTLVVAFGLLVGLLIGVALAGGGIPLSHMLALALQLACFGACIGAVAVAIGAGTGQRRLAGGVAGAVGICGWLIDSLAPLVTGIGWLKYTSPFYYYATHDPLARGFGWGGALVLLAAAIALTLTGMLAMDRRDLRA